MGTTNNSADKVSIEDKIKYLQNTIAKKCSYHQKNVTLFCSHLTCNRSPFICPECTQTSVHDHKDKIQDMDDFIKTIVQLIQAYQSQSNRVLDDQESRDYAWLIKEEMKMMEHIELLQSQVVSMISEFKKNLQEDLTKNISKANKSAKSQTDLYFKFYANPNILVNKIISDPSDEFVLSLKKKLTQQKQQPELTPEQEINQHKNSLNFIKENIKELMNVNTTNFFRNKAPSVHQYADVTGSLKKIIPPISSNEYPLKLWSSGGSVVASTNRDLWQFEAISKNKMKLGGGTITQLYGEGDNYIGVLNPTTLLVCDGKRSDKMSFITKISSVCLLKSQKNTYVLLGEEEGVFTVIRMEQAKTVFHYRCGDTPLKLIQKCDKNSTILCSSSSGPLFIFKYQIKYDEYEFHYMGQLSNSIFPYGEIQLLKVDGYDLILFGPCRNIVIFDLMLNAQVLRTQYTQNSPTFVEACLCKVGNSEIILTLSQNENVIYSWIIDKGKKSVKVDPLVMKSGASDSVIVSMCTNREQLWIGRDGSKEISTYTLSF